MGSRKGEGPEFWLSHICPKANVKAGGQVLQDSCVDPAPTPHLNDGPTNKALT